MAKKTSRRNFLRTAPVAAAAGFTLADSLSAMAQAGSSGEEIAAAAQPYKLWSDSEIKGDIQALDAKPGDNKLYESKAIPEQIILTVEKHKSAPLFEWHQGRDHILQVIDGSTTYEIGGKPTGIIPLGPGEWHAKGSEGAKTITLNKGDMLLIPRGTLHKRSTPESVTFLLISNPAPKA